MSAWRNWQTHLFQKQGLVGSSPTAGTSRFLGSSFLNKRMLQRQGISAEIKRGAQLSLMHSSCRLIGRTLTKLREWVRFPSVGHPTVRWRNAPAGLKNRGSSPLVSNMPRSFNGKDMRLRTARCRFDSYTGCQTN